MTDGKNEPAHPHPHLPGGTGTGPAGGEPVKPTTPARDPAAEAAALAAFEDQEHPLAEADLPAPPRAPAARDAVPTPAAPQISGGTRMAPLGKPLTNPPVVVFDGVTKTYGTGRGAYTAIRDV